jgi:Uma2 family endonuclease
LESPEPKNEYLGFVPDWVCEIQSERTDERLSLYSEHEVSYVWLVDRRTQTFEVLRRDGTRWISA